MLSSSAASTSSSIQNGVGLTSSTANRSAIAESAGKPVIVGHAYLGGSTLEQQYHGIDDTSYTYKHRDIDQTVHDTYQYWKYTGSENPVKTPSEGYKNGLAGIGVTLESVVKDEPWDIMVFQPHVIVKAHMPDYCGFDINNLVGRIKSMMKPEVAAAVKCGLMVPFSYPEGNTDYRQNVVEAYNNGVWPANQNKWDSLYDIWLRKSSSADFASQTIRTSSLPRYLYIVAIL